MARLTVLLEDWKNVLVECDGIVSSRRAGVADRNGDDSGEANRETIPQHMSFSCLMGCTLRPGLGVNQSISDFTIFDY
jgi:hypothetical protein